MQHTIKMKTLIVDIENLNENDSLAGLSEKLPFNIVFGISEYTNNSSFLVTDNLHAADFAKRNNIGIAVYVNGKNNPSDFPEALYCIDNMSEMTAITLERMYLRAVGLPWEITTTERCLIREITVDDVDRLYEIYSDEDVVRYIENLYEDRNDEIEYTKQYIDNQYRFYEYGLWIVEDLETHEIIGRAGIFDRDNQDEKELGFVFAKEYWGKGYAREVLEAIIRYVYEELEIETLLAHAVHENVRSKHLLEKLGFKYAYEAVMDGKNYDRYVTDLSLIN